MEDCMLILFSFPPCKCLQCAPNAVRVKFERPPDLLNNLARLEERKKKQKNKKKNKKKRRKEGDAKNNMSKNKKK